MEIEFEWDARKAAKNLRKHGVAFEEAMSVFSDPLARIFDDPDHSQDERREIIIGYSSRPRGLHGASGARPSNPRPAGDAGRDETP